MTETLQMKEDVGASAWATRQNIKKCFLNTEKWFTVDAPSYTIKTWALTKLLSKVFTT